MTKLEWHTEKRVVKQLIPYKSNPRTLLDSHGEKLMESISKLGLAEIPAIDIDNTIIAGHMRMKAMIALGRGEEEIDVRIPNRKLTKKEFTEYNIISNVPAGEWDFNLLKDIDTTILLDSLDENTLSNLWSENLSVEDDEFRVDEEIAKIRTPKTKLGDLILLGEHRLYCGDSVDPEVVKKLIGDHKINILNYDPIYNIGLDYNKGIGTKGKYGGKVNDKKSDPEYHDFLKIVLQNGLDHCSPDTHIFCWCDERYIGLLQSLYSELGIENKRVCLWIKNNASPTPQIAFNKVFEACTYGTRGAPYLSPSIHNLNEVMNKEIGTGNRLTDDILDIINIWLVKRVNAQDYTHATEKPASLYEKALRRCSRPGDIILDLFAGSGAQMSACEQLKRRLFMCEIEPIFCDLIVERYRRLTGKEPVYVNS